MTLCRHALPTLCRRSAGHFPANGPPRSADGSHGEKKCVGRHALPRRSAESHAPHTGTAQPARGGLRRAAPWHGGFLSEVVRQTAGDRHGGTHP